ncbi:MAG TPA: HAD-IA family hydrolase [Blastocatellia bacterium]|nr:HAD-IA family hydrolase [Blastocatellia bacterium]
MTDFDLLIFDMDGVLVDTTECHSRAYEDLWRLVGIAGPPYEEIAGRKTAEVVSEVTVLLNPSSQQIVKWVNFKQQRARQYLTTEKIAFYDSVESIERLRLRGSRLRLAIGTGASRETTAMVLARLEWGEAFSVIVTGEDVLEGKPAPEIYLAAMERAGASPQRTLIIEDSKSGLAAAIASQAYTASVRSGVQAQGKRFIGSFPDVRSLLAVLNHAQ